MLQRYEDDGATMSKYGINPRARQFPNHRHPTTQHALYSVIPTLTHIPVFVRTMYFLHATYASSHKSALLHPVPAKLTQSLLRIRILPGKTTTPYHPSIQVSHDVMHSCCSMLCDNIAWALHLSEVCPSPLSTVSHCTEEISKYVHSNQRCDRQHPRRVATRPTNMLQTEFH